MKLTKRKLLSLIEGYLLEDEGEETKSKEYNFGKDINVELKDGITLTLKSSDNGGVAATMKLANGGVPKDHNGKEIEQPMILTGQDVEEKNKRLAVFSNVVGGILCAMRRDGMQSEIKNILTRLNDLIDMTPVMKLRSAIVYYDSIKLNNEDSSSARIAEHIATMVSE